MSRLKIEAVTVSVGYSDFLREVAPLNRPLLDRWVVVTDPNDWETREVCRDFSIECILSGDIKRDGGFNKARGINKGLDLLTGDGWLLHLDGDIALTPDFHQCLEGADLRPGNIYGCDRLCVTGWDNWQRARAGGLTARSGGWLIEKNRPGSWLGGVVVGQQRSWAPIGFFQLWHAEETLKWGFPRRRYPETHGGAARTDVQFSLQWDRSQRAFIPDLVVFHLESEDATIGANWDGRKTARFAAPGAKTPAAAAGPKLAASRSY